MDEFLGGLFGGDQDESDDARRQRGADFVNRVEQGDPFEGFSAEEAIQNYKSVTSRLTDSEYQDVARGALARFGPDQRREFGRLLAQGADANIQGDTDDPDEVAQLMSQLRISSGGGLSDLLRGGGEEDYMEAISGLLGGGGGEAKTDESGLVELLGNPVVKAVLAAIAAASMRKYGIGDLDGW